LIIRRYQVRYYADDFKLVDCGMATPWFHYDASTEILDMIVQSNSDLNADGFTVEDMGYTEEVFLD